MPLLVFAYFFAFSCLFADGSTSVFPSLFALNQFLSVLGIFLCGTIMCLLTVITSTKHQAHQVLYVLIFLIMVICFLCTYLLGENVLATLPLYVAREFIVLLVFWSAFMLDDYSARIRRFALSVTLWITSWFAYRVLRWLLDTLTFPSSYILEILSLAVLMVIAVFVFFGLIKRYGKDDHIEKVLDPESNRKTDRRTEALEKLSANYGLTSREKELLPYLALGFSAEYIAEKFIISPATVRTHAHNIYLKTGVNSQRKLSEMIDSLVV
jgi:DNA-binding CsgD family transcriptional regulator